MIVSDILISDKSENHAWLTYNKSFKIDDWVRIGFVVVMDFLGQLGNIMSYVNNYNFVSSEYFS